MMANKPLGRSESPPLRDRRFRDGEHGRFGGKFLTRMQTESQEAATLNDEQRAEIDRRVAAHAARVAAELAAIGERCAATTPETPDPKTRAKKSRAKPSAEPIRGDGEGIGELYDRVPGGAALTALQPADGAQIEASTAG